MSKKTAKSSKNPKVKPERKHPEDNPNKKKDGNVLKSTKYLDDLKDRTKEKEHPRHHNVRMQAHHVISAEGVNRSKLGDKLKDFGYDINHWRNLVFIPSSLQGACYLGVQPHRGNHSASEMDDDQSHPGDYHDTVSRKVIMAKRHMKGKCVDRGEQIIVLGMMNSISEEILHMIQAVTIRLTRVAKSFVPGNNCGCAGVDNIPLHNPLGVCPSERVHINNKHGNKQTKENITFEKKENYKLKMGS